MQREALQQLSETYATALRLPGVDFVSSPDPPSQGKIERNKLAENLRSMPFQYYWEMFTPTDMDEGKEPVCGDLFDDFLDIFGDLSRGLWLYDRKHFEAAVFFWLQMFGVHWGATRRQCHACVALIRAKGAKECVLTSCCTRGAKRAREQWRWAEN